MPEPAASSSFKRGWLAVLLIVAGSACGSTRAIHLLESAHLDETRVIQIAVPQVGDPGQRFPTLYVLDAEWVFDYAVGLVGFLSGDVVGVIPPMIVVGVPNTDRQRDLFVDHSEDGGYHRFLKFLTDELKPMVERDFATNGFDVLYTFSSGVGLSHRLLGMNSPFAAQIESGSGSGSRTLSYLRDAVPRQRYDNRHLFVSTEELGPRVPGLRRYEALMDELAPEGLRMHFEVLAGEDHGDVLISGLEAGLRFVFADFKLPENLNDADYPPIKAFFGALPFGADLRPPAGLIGGLAETRLSAGQIDAAISLLTNAIADAPASITLREVLARAHLQSGQSEKAAFLLSEAMSLAQSDVATWLRLKTARDAIAASQDRGP